MEVYKPLFVEL
jgi:hypothetical protein